MESVKVKIIKTAVTAMYGTLGEGDILITSAQFARHLVEDCSAAEYLTAEEKPSVVVEESKPAGKKQKV